MFDQRHGAARIASATLHVEDCLTTAAVLRKYAAFSQLYTLDDDGNALPYADTHRAQRKAPTSTL
jgi:hypothetical protein